MFSGKSCRRRSSRLTVKEKAPPGTKPRTYRGISQAQANGGRRDALRFPDLRLLITDH
jgi:hypothetical protein